MPATAASFTEPSALRIARDHYQAAATLEHVLERLAEPLEFSLPANERLGGHHGRNDSNSGGRQVGKSNLRGTVTDGSARSSPDLQSAGINHSPTPASTLVSVARGGAREGIRTR